jgi:hypothetical protein
MKNIQLQSNKKCENNENILIQKNSTKNNHFCRRIEIEAFIFGRFF